MRSQILEYIINLDALNALSNEHASIIIYDLLSTATLDDLEKLRSWITPKLAYLFQNGCARTIMLHLFTKGTEFF